MALRATLGHESHAAKDTDFRFLYVTFNGAKRTSAESKDLHFARLSSSRIFAGTTPDMLNLIRASARAVPGFAAPRSQSVG
jgi:hypothetical protein